MGGKYLSSLYKFSLFILFTDTEQNRRKNERVVSGQHQKGEAVSFIQALLHLDWSTLLFHTIEDN